MSIDIELLPCPHCGGAAQIDSDNDDRGNRVIGCVDCGANVGANMLNDGVKRWNRRAAIPQAPTEQPPQRRAPSEADSWLGLAHIICDEAGIPPGHILRRLAALSEKADKGQAPTEQAPTSEPVGVAGYQMIARPEVFYPASHKPTDINNFRALFAAPVGQEAQAASKGWHDLIAWLLGKNGTFPNRASANEGLYWWRKELRERYEKLRAAVQPPASTEPAPMNHSTGYRCTSCCAKSGEPHLPGCDEGASLAVVEPANVCPLCEDQLSDHAWNCGFDPKNIDQDVLATGTEPAPPSAPAMRGKP